jgi:hypothetical protein
LRTFETFETCHPGEHLIQPRHESSDLRRVQTFETFASLNRHRQPLAETLRLEVLEANHRGLAGTTPTVCGESTTTNRLVQALPGDAGALDRLPKIEYFHHGEVFLFGANVC